jgi:hypothetical protein
MKEYVNVEKVFVAASVDWDLCNRDSELAIKYVKSKLAHLIAEELLKHDNLMIFEEQDVASLRAKVIRATLKIATDKEEEK